MARLYEYQGKELLKHAGIPVPESGLASTPQEAHDIAARLGKPVVVKAQVWTTGRSKVGGIKFAETPEEAAQTAALLGSEIKGWRVEKVLVEEKLDVESEFYAGVIVDNSHRIRAPRIIFSTQGGVDIEETANTTPDRIVNTVVNIFEGITPTQLKEVLSPLGIAPAVLEALSGVVGTLYRVFRCYDARSAEINPLVLTKDGRIFAADCRISIDDASVDRHPELGIRVPRESDTPPSPLDRIGWTIEERDFRGVTFFAQMVSNTSMGGYIGYHAIGGGGALLAADALVRHGLRLANYAETSGNPTAAKVYRTARVILSQPALDGYCLLGAVIASQDQWHHAHGLVKAFRELLADRPGFPVVILIAGNKEKETLEILREGLSNLPIALELYGREHIQKLDYVAGRMKTLVDAYRSSNCRERAEKFVRRVMPTPLTAIEVSTFKFRTGSLTVNRKLCRGCTSRACAEGCTKYGAGLLLVQGGDLSFSVPLDQLPRLCTECLACEHECYHRGNRALSLTFNVEQ